MLACMSKRPRLIIDMPEPLRRALNAHAGFRGRSPSEIVCDLLRANLPAEEIRKAEEAVAAEESGHAAPPSKRPGRKPSSEKHRP